MNVETLAAGAVGAILAFLGNWIIQKANFHRSVRDQRRMAAMEVATQLRRWAATAVGVVSDISLHDQTDGHLGHDHTAIADFPFETTLTRVSMLGPALAGEVFGLIHARDEMQSDVTSTADVADSESARERFRQGVAGLYLSAVPIYEKLAKEAGWATFKFPETEVTFMENESDDRASKSGRGSAAVV